MFLFNIALIVERMNSQWRYTWVFLHNSGSMDSRHQYKTQCYKKVVAVPEDMQYS